MSHSAASENLHAALHLKKTIDAICDRFEEAWTAGRHPRIEEYISEVEPASRQLLFSELLATELAFRAGDDFKIAKQRCLARFPEYADIITEIFADLADSATARRLGLIREVQSRVGGDVVEPAPPPTAEGGVPDETLVFARAAPAPLIHDLWDRLIARAQELNPATGRSNTDSATPEQLEAVVQSLLQTFPPLRREALLSLLLGNSIESTSQRLNVTERTVTATLETANSLLARRQ